MPNIKSAKKRVLVNKTRAARNKSRNTALKTAIKKANIAAAANAPETEALVKEAVKKVDQPLRALSTRTMQLTRSRLLPSSLNKLHNQIKSKTAVVVNFL